jgi:hypothetical protein
MVRSRGRARLVRRCCCWGGWVWHDRWGGAPDCNYCASIRVIEVRWRRLSALEAVAEVVGVLFCETKSTTTKQPEVKSWNSMQKQHGLEQQRQDTVQRAGRRAVHCAPTPAPQRQKPSSCSVLSKTDRLVQPGHLPPVARANRRGPSDAPATASCPPKSRHEALDRRGWKHEL